MKQLRLAGFVLGTALLFTACNGDDTPSEKKKETQQQVEPTEIVEIEHEIDAPFVYPFGLELENFELEGYRSNCGGDCCNELIAMSLGAYTVFSDSSDCGEYGSQVVHYLYRGEELMAVHEQFGGIEQVGEADFQWVIDERTIDFENEKRFTRKDTIFAENDPGTKGTFEEQTFDRSVKYDYQHAFYDPRKYQKFDSVIEFSFVHNTSEGKLKPVWFTSNFKPSVDMAFTEAYSWQEISNYETRNIPEDALFAYSTWWAGGGDIFYGKFNDGVLQVYHSYEDEALSDIPEYQLYFEVDPDVTEEKPHHYIVFDPDLGKNRLMIGMNDAGGALYAKYEGQSRHIELKFQKDKSYGKTIQKEYVELIHGVPNGKYTIIHEGIHDYVLYQAKNGKESKFTINHDLSTLVGGGYRDLPLF